MTVIKQCGHSQAQADLRRAARPASCRYQPVGTPHGVGGLTAGQRDLALRNRVRGASAEGETFPLGPPAAQRVPKDITHAVFSLETC